MSEPPRHPRLDSVDLSGRIGEEQERDQLAQLSRRLLSLRLANAGLLDRPGHGQRRLGPPVCVIFEGWDASGKGGNIRRLANALDPRHLRVVQFGPPDPEAARHHFLWRFVGPLPGAGGMTIFDRSWYGRVLVERVEGLATAEQWRRAYDEIVEFESMMVSEGTVLIKLWLHLTADEQLRRFEQRQADPLKRWKLTDDDWRNRSKWSAYEDAVEEMLARTDRADTPWDVVPAQQNRFGRVVALRTVVERIEAGMLRAWMTLPSAEGYSL